MNTMYWCSQAVMPDGAVARGLVLAEEGGRFSEVTPNVAQPPAGATVLEGLTLPGLANAHSHAFQRALRGRTHGEGGTFWTWRQRMYELAGRLNPEWYLDLATATYAEMVECGYTCVGEFHYLHHRQEGEPYHDPNAMGEVLVEAARLAGIRITLLDVCYIRGGINVPLTSQQRRFCDGTVAAWVERVDLLTGLETSSVRVGAAAHSVRALLPDELAAVARWSQARDCRPLHVHVSEQRAENDACYTEYGCTPVELLDRHGVVGPQAVLVHATHITENDLQRIFDRGATVCLCPTTERDLADGIGPAGRLAEVGVALCVGSDSHAVIDPFEETRAVELDERLSTGHRGTLGAAPLVRAVSAGGYRALGWPEGGQLVPGGPADAVTVGLDSVRLAGYDPADPLAAVVFAATASDVRDVVVAGRHIVRNGQHATVDVPGLLRSSIEKVWR